MLRFFFFFMVMITVQNSSARWAEETLEQMSLKEKIGQLFVIGLHNAELGDEQQTNTLQANENCKSFTLELAQELIEQYKVGGVIFIGYGTLMHGVEGIRQMQSLSEIPLLIVQDFEWGLQMRYTDCMKLPFAMTLGAIQDDELLYRMGQEVGRQCKLMGVHINCAPVVDINNNPRNPVINYRSFGEAKELVARKALQFMLGLQNAGILACAKHFCGHGDVEIDSHLDLPTITHDLQRLEAIELYPFRRLIDAGVDAVMSAHIHVPALDDRLYSSVTLSSNAIQHLLKNRLGFHGLVMTDALNMKAVTRYFSPSEIALQAFLAGNHLLLLSEDVPASIEAIKTALEKEPLFLQELDARVLKILKAKESFMHTKRIKKVFFHISSERST